MSTDLEFNKVTFGLPVEAFRIDAYITKDERLPVVTEYVLRAIRICESLTPAGLRDFFGFSDAEALTIVEVLTRQGLVTLAGDEIRLSSYATERFDASSSEDYPRFTKVEPRRDSVTLDLLSFSPLLAPRFGFLTENSLRLETPEDAIGHSTERAKRTYTTRFHEVANLNDRLRDSAVSVYAVEDVQSRKRGYLPIPVSFALGDEEQVERRAARNFEEGAAPELRQAFHEAVSSIIPTALTVGNAQIERFMEAFDLGWLDPFVTGKRFDIRGYARRVVDGEMGTPKGVKPLFGNLYLDRNLELLVEAIASSGSQQRHRLTTSAAWLGPDHFLWGRGEAFQQAVSRIGDTVQSASQDELHLFLATEHGRERPTADRFRGVEHGPLHAFRLPPSGDGTLGGRLELFLYPTGLAAAMFHLSLPGSSGLWAPIGFLSTQADHCAAIHKLLLSLAGGQQYGGRLDKVGQAQERPMNFEGSCGFLNYVSLRASRPPQTT